MTDTDVKMPPDHVFGSKEADNEYFGNLRSFQWFTDQVKSAIGKFNPDVHPDDINERARMLYLQDELKAFENKTITPDLAQKLSDLTIHGWDRAPTPKAASYRTLAAMQLFNARVNVLTEVSEAFKEQCPHTLVNENTTDISDGYACPSHYVTTTTCRICGKNWETDHGIRA
jgi:hypothetical protein